MAVSQPSEVEPEEFKRVVELLDFEITQIRAEESQPGWTTWALLGGLATTLWLLGAELEAHRVNPRAIAFLFLVFYLAFKTIKSLHRLLSLPSPSLGSASRFRLSHNWFSQTRTSILFEIIQAVALIYIVTIFRPTLPSLVSLVAFIFFGIDVLASVIAFILSFLKIPFADFRNQPPSKRRLVPMSFVIVGLPIAALVGFTGPLWNGTILASVSEYRVAGLLIAITEIVIILTKRGPDTPLLKTLIDLRRNLAFGKLELEDAKRQAEIALEGMTASDVLQDELAGLLSHIEEINIELESASKEIHALTTTISKESPNLSEEQKALLMAVRQSVETHLGRVAEIQERLSGRLNKLRRRASFMLGMSPEAKDTLMPLGTGIPSALSFIDIRKKQLIEQMRALNERVRD